MRFSDSTHHDMPKPINYANSDSSPLNSDESLSDEISSQNDPTSLNLQNLLYHLLQLPRIYSQKTIPLP